MMPQLPKMPTMKPSADKTEADGAVQSIKNKLMSKKQKKPMPATAVARGLNVDNFRPYLGRNKDTASKDPVGGIVKDYLTLEGRTNAPAMSKAKEKPLGVAFDKMMKKNVNPLSALSKKYGSKKSSI